MKSVMLIMFLVFLMASVFFPRIFPGTPVLTPESSELLIDGPMDRQNWVSSHTQDVEHYVPGFTLSSNFNMQNAASLLVQKMGQCRIIKVTETYAHLEFRTTFLSFVDDVELLWESSGEVLAIKSASRWGISDFGTNRKRYEEIKRTFLEGQVIRGQLE